MTMTCGQCGGGCAASEPPPDAPRGARLVLLATWVFLLPLAVTATAIALLEPRLGPLPALAAGVAASAIAVWPAGRLRGARRC